MTLQFDHAVILVRDLNAAINDYRQLGFNAFFGGEHAGGKTHNALIVFADGTYVELLAPTRPELLQTVDPTDRTNFLFMFQYGEGFGGYALLSPDLNAETEAMQKRGLDVQLRPPGGRARPDGQQLRWQSAMVGGSMTPFFIQDVTPRVLRVPIDADKIQQPNGISGVKGIRIAVVDLSIGLQCYEAMLNLKPNAENAEFQVGDFTVRLIQSDVPEDRIHALILSGKSTQTLDLALTHGAQIDVIG
jgi:catechol 2,3-dioxygenase-like lactoylglutathione lyase family enzyme